MNSVMMVTGENGLSLSTVDTVRRLARIAGFVIFSAIAAQLAVRLPYTPVPVTMQTLFVVLAGIVLGPRDGFYAMISYVALGVAGAPVFAGFSFGPAIIVGPTGGYLMAFPIAALVAGSLSRSLGGGRVAVLASAAVGTSLILLAGTLYLSILTGLSLSMAVSLGITPFLAGAFVKSLSAMVIAGRKR
ncbi:MAG: biotin transporter BioY [Candidatus Krumholzibacteriota bacterium]|nr:biotin transporter BioY [Candidatus Krumholzibacteriota bacterium]